jgi:hypothetical protein
MPDLDKIDRTIKALLAESVPNKEDGGISYLLHHIRNDLYVPIEISREKGLGNSEYYLAFSRLSNEEINSNEVKQLDAAIPVLLKRGRVESLCFRGCKHTSFWQELIPLSANNRLVLVRASCKEFAPVPLSARRFAFPGYNLTHSIWEEAGAAFLASQNLSAGDNTSCNELVEHLARHLADEQPFPPYFDLVNFHLEVKAAHDLTACRQTRCNPLGFTSGVVVDFKPEEWPWITEMAKPIDPWPSPQCYVQHIPYKYRNVLSGTENTLYRSIIENTQDLVVRVSEYSASGEKWWFFARHNRKKEESETVTIEEVAPHSCPYSAVASIIERQPIGKDHLVTLWALDPDKPLSAIAVGSRVEKSRFSPEILPLLDAAAVEDNTISAKSLIPGEFVRITIQPRTGCSKEQINSLRTSLQEICDATLTKVRSFAPHERLKSFYRNILDVKNENGHNVWVELFNPERLHDGDEFKKNATQPEWENLRKQVIAALEPISREIKLWECFRTPDEHFNCLYLHAAKSFEQCSLCPELCVMFAGGLTVMFPAKGSLLLYTTTGNDVKEKACEIAAGLMLLVKQGFVLADAEFPSTSNQDTKWYPHLKLRFESLGTDIGGGSGKAKSTVESDSSADNLREFEMSKIKDFNINCFDNVQKEEFGKRSKFRTALQLLRKYADVYSTGFTAKRKELVPTVFVEFKCYDKSSFGKK